MWCRQRSPSYPPAALPLGKRPGTHCTGGWVGPRAGLDGCGCSKILNLLLWKGEKFAAQRFKVVPNPYGKGRQKVDRGKVK